MQLIQLKDIKISEIGLSASNEEVERLYEDIYDLADNISKIGLIQPLVVYKNTHNSYTILSGRRRFLALQKLGWKTIRVIVTSPPLTDIDGKIIYLCENLIRKDIPNKNTVDILTNFYLQNGSIKAVIDRIGLNATIIRKYVKFARLPKNVQEAVKNGMISLNNALKAADLLEWDADQIQQEDNVLEVSYKMERSGSKIMIEESTDNLNRPNQSLISDFI